jgi:UDP-N-acetyl-D-glucosamine dehydrogenase
VTEFLPELVDRISGGEASVSVVGQGYVGLSLTSALARAGHRVLALDLDADRVAALSQGRQVVAGVDSALFAQGHATGLISFSTEVDRAGESDVVVICVPTPVTDHRPDLQAVEAAGRSVAARLHRGCLVVLESTTYPGTTEQLLRPLLEAGSGLTAGTDFLLAYSPERIDPGNVKYGLRNTPRVVGGLDEASTTAATAFYARVVDDVHAMSSTRAAEMAKLLENTFRMVNIALVNELATLCADQGIDVWEVIAGAATKPFGFMTFYPGPGVGGHCIPLDPTYLAWQSRRDTGRPFRVVETAQDVNADMPRHVAARVVDALNDRRIAVRGARLLALGVTYKPDVGDLRESAPVEVMARLERRGAVMSFHDPFVDQVRLGDRVLHRTELTADAVSDADMILLLTPHSSYDVADLVARSRAVFDARNATGPTSPGWVVKL